jgi:FAD binding domain-containing protein/berberine-like enzyme
MADSSSVMAPFFANQSCDPFQPRERPCLLGNHVVYAVDARSPEDISAAIAFATEHDIRFVIRNTGHDYNGRSTGAGALSVWVHHMKDIEFLDWEGPSAYRGKAVKVAAGVQGFEVTEAANKLGLAVVGGECPTVGLAGGYTQGGGHSALSTSFGLGADNVLEWEVVTAQGELIKANADENADLFWALNGGGGGNWGVTTSLTVKAHSDAIVSGATLVFLAAENEADIFYAAIDAFHEELAAIVDAGSMVIYYFSVAFFQIGPLSAFGKTESQVRDMLTAFTSRLDNLGIKYAATYSESPTYRDHYDEYFGPLPIGNIQVGIAQYGGRLIPRASITNITSFARSIGSHEGVIFIGVGTDVSSFGGDNAVLPAWRDTLVHATLTTPWSFEVPWEDMLAAQDLMTEVLMPEIEALTPGGGAYMNEADFRQPRWQEEFFGVNYAKLKCVKQKWDPEGFFYALNGVGSEQWVVGGDGRMCRA